MIEDLAQRTNMVALNASVQANELGEAGRGFVVVSREVERLAERAGNTTKHISSLNKTIQAEINETEAALKATAGEAATLSKFAIETGGALGELEKYVTGVLNLQNKIVSYSREQRDETEQAFQVFVKGISETEKSLVGLKASAGAIVKISTVMENLQATVEDFKMPANTAESEESKSLSLAAVSSGALLEQPVPFITFGEDSL
jgi:methyl-accepting chemotaxis protein